MLRASLAALAASLLAVAPLAAQAKPKAKPDSQARFVPGWYIVQQGAEYTPVILAASDIQADSTHGQLAAQMVTLRPGEAVFAIENSRGTYLVYEWFGRMSAVRGDSALRRAPAGGRPAYVTKDVQMMDGTLHQGSAVWVKSIDAGSGKATVQLEGGRTEVVPNESVEVLMNAFSETLRAASWRTVD